MTIDKYNVECAKRGINPDSAMENYSIMESLMSGNDSALIEALDTYPEWRLMQ